MAKMKGLVLALALLALLECSAAYSAYARATAGYPSSYASASSYTSASSSSSTSAESPQFCCRISTWGYGHMHEVREVANRLRQEYNQLSQGGTAGYSRAEFYPWSEGIISLTGKTSSELDDICHRLMEEVVSQLRAGNLSYSTIAKAHFFESKAADTLESYANSASDYGQQQQQILDVGHFQPVDLSNYDEVKNYAYPAEVKVIDGKTYVVHKNCTEATKTMGEGTYQNPMVTVLKRNRTIITTNTGMPAYATGSYGTNGGFQSSSMINAGGSPAYPAASVYAQPGGMSSTTITRKKTVYDWVNQNMEPGVVGYNPVSTVNTGDWTSASQHAYQPVVHIPVSGGSTNSDVETFNTGANNYYRPSYGPGSTVTIRRYNKTIITNPDGTNSVSGSELNRKWVDGKLVYDSERPFGEWTVPRGEAWKREERERFFWFLTQGNTTSQRLEAWQRQQEERLLGLAERYHITVEEVLEWHRKELERYKILQGQYQAQNNNLTGWKRVECGRLDWLIHQNSVTREELERWQRENQDKLAQLARQYRISLEELKNWQIEELNRLYVYFNDQNNSMISRPSSGSLHTDSEQERLEELIRQHNATIAQLHNSIKLDQQKLIELSTKYRGNVQDMEKWLKSELARLGGIITDQRNEMTRITEWQRSERERLENLVKVHRGSTDDLETQMARDRTYIQSLASKYHVSIEELEKWQRAELERLHKEGQSQLEMNIKEWQRREREHLMSIAKKNDLTIEEFQAKIMSDRARLENLAKTYKVQVSEVEEWIKNEIKNFQSQGLLKEVEKELAQWQQKERDRLLAIVQQNEVTVEELETKIKNDQSHLYGLANTYQVRVEEIEEWLKKELQRLQGEGLIKVEDLKDWQKSERGDILKIVQENKLTIEEFEKKLLNDRKRLQDLSRIYNVQTTEIESWIKKEGERLQSLGLIQMQEQLNNWQKIERERLLDLVKKNNLSITELEEKIKKDQVHLYSLARQHQVRVEEIEEWIKKEIKKLQQEGLIEMEKLKDWQTEWRGNLTNMVKERDFTVEEFHKWLLEDRARLQTLAMQHNVQIEEIEQWITNEEQRFVSMGLLKPNEKLTNWQEVERNYLERITHEHYRSTEQLEQRLRQDRELLEQLAREYSVQVEEIEKWMQKELTRLRDDGQLQIDNLTAWQIAERERLEKLIKENKQWSVEELEMVLRKDQEHMQKMAFKYHTSVEEIEKWVQSEVDRLKQQGKLNVQQLTEWQKTEQQRIMNLLKLQSSTTAEEFERKVQQDRDYLNNLANQYHVSVIEIEEYVKKVIDDLREKGKFEVGNLQTWQIVERDYIKQLIGQYNNDISTKEYENKLLQDRAHLRQLSDQYRVNVEQIEKWMIEELQRLRKDSENQVKQLAAWQVSESQRLKDLIRQHNHLSYVEFEVELSKERARLQELANQYSVSVEEIETWLRQQLVNLKTTGQVQVESLTQWQETEQKRLIDMLLQQQNNISFEEFEKKLQNDRARLQQLAREYSISVEQIETWMRDELQRLKNSGLLQVEQLTHWQKIERDRLQDWLKQQHNAATQEEFNSFLKRDQQRLQRIAQDYHVTVEEVESWVKQEGARLQILGMIKRPEQYIYEDHTSNDEMWKVHTSGHLKAIAQVRLMNQQQFESYLAEERMRWEQFARQYNITVEEIEQWLRSVAQKERLIQGGVTTQEWQINEVTYIQNLVNDKLRKQQKWSVEELERQLRRDREHLQRIATQYHITIEELENWYAQELQRLLQQQKLISEHLADWQRREKERLYTIVSGQPGRSVQYWEEQLLRDKSRLNNLADEYHIAIEELEMWIRNELRRLSDLGHIQGQQSSSNSKHWQDQERERLRAIAATLTITEEELLEYIAGDHSYQQRLASMYGCALDQLAPFQRIVISQLQREGLYDNTKLLRLENWQQRERDRLYSLIKNQNFSMKNLRDWQRQDMFLNELAGKYGIAAQVLKDWQIREYERLMRVAEHYDLTLGQLQDFREKEMRYITYVMHKMTSSEEECIQMDAYEARRMETLERKTGLSGEELLAWRRKLYLLAQGRLPMDFDSYGGFEIGKGSTNRTAPPHQEISKDRGDQPPNIYEESVDGDEPGIAGQDPLFPSPNAELRVEPSTKRPQPYMPTINSGVSITSPGGSVQSGYSYTKKEMKFTVPMGVGHADMSNGGTRMRYERERENVDDGQQQQQEELTDFGQQQQVDLGWNGKLQDGGQQQVQTFGGHYGGSHGIDTSSGHSYGNAQQQVEDFGQQQQVELGDFGQQQQVELGDYKQHAYGQQQVEVEDLSASVAANQHGASQKQVDSAANTGATVEVTAEPEADSFWGKLKQKTSNIFG